MENVQELSYLGATLSSDGRNMKTILQKKNKQISKKKQITELRALERIEEDQMRNVLQVKTGIQVPLHLMYLDLGQTPARYQIYRFKINFLQYILQQEKETLLFKMLDAQQIRPVRGDWFSDVRQIMQELNITRYSSRNAPIYDE